MPLCLCLCSCFGWRLDVIVPLFEQLLWVEIGLDVIVSLFGQLLWVEIGLDVILCGILGAIPVLYTHDFASFASALSNDLCVSNDVKISQMYCKTIQSARRRPRHCIMSTFG
eukprot:413459_1